MSHAAHADQHSEGHADGHGHAHGHTIIPMRMLVLVLATLLVFTGLTVFVANAEILIARAFGITLPHWVNIVVALSIAAVKSIIVAAYFMQLRYDNPLNTMVAVFTLLVLTFFLGFTMIDLGNRKALYDYKGTAKIDGGYGNVPIAGGLQVPDQMSIAMFARQRADQQIDSLLAEGKELNKTLGARLVYRTMELEEAGKPIPETYEKYLQKHPALVAYVMAKSHGHGGGHDDKHAGSTGNAARIRTGVTLPELLPAGAEHGGTSPESKADPKAGSKSGH